MAKDEIIWNRVEFGLPHFKNERVLVRSDAIEGYPGVDTDMCVNGHWLRYGDTVTHWAVLPDSIFSSLGIN